ncbi:MAG TPA: hypothetical protein VGA78_03675 [Gemmatimonadales bacterium]|jgi:hypothetical protein
MPAKHSKRKGDARGVEVETARNLILALPGITEGRSYGFPSFLLEGRFFARFRDDDTVLVLQLGTITDREVLMQLDPRACFFTEHYRNSPAVLIRLAEVARPMLADALKVAWEEVSAQRARRPHRTRPRR